MTHYGIAGFGTAAAYAKALGLKDDNKSRARRTGNLRRRRIMTKLAETAVNIDAKTKAEGAAILPSDRPAISVRFTGNGRKPN